MGVGTTLAVWAACSGACVRASDDKRPDQTRPDQRQQATVVAALSILVCNGLFCSDVFVMARACKSATGGLSSMSDARSGPGLHSSLPLERTTHTSIRPPHRTSLMNTLPIYTTLHCRAPADLGGRVRKPRVLYKSVRVVFGLSATCVDRAAVHTHTNEAWGECSLSKRPDTPE